MARTKPADAVTQAVQKTFHGKGTAGDLADPATPMPATAPAFADATAPVPKGPAAWAYERVVMYIRNFEHRLNVNEEVVLGHAGSEAGILQIEGIGFYDPDLITFYGRDENGMKTQMIQHVSQLSVMLRAVPKPRPEEPARRIGFRLASGWLGGESGDGSA